MRISNTLIDKKIFRKYFYSCIDNKEYILFGNEFGNLHSCGYSERTGKIIIDILNNNLNISEIIKGYVSIIENTYSEDEEELQMLIMNNLKCLRIELSQKGSKFFHNLFFENLYAKQYQEIFNTYNIEKERSENFTELIKQISSTSSNSNDILDFYKNLLKKSIDEVNKYENINFKNFVLDKLNKLAEKIETFKNTYDVLSENRKNFRNISNTIEKNNLTSKLYDIKSYGIFLPFHKDKIIFNHEIKPDSYKLVQYYEINDIIDLIDLTFVQCFNGRSRVNRCSNCGKYFFYLKRSDEKFCTNISPDRPDKTCKEIGAYKNKRHKIKSNRISHEKHNADSFFWNKKNRAKTEKEKEKIDRIWSNFKIEYPKQREKFEKQKITEDEFVKWIQNQKNLTQK